MGNYRVQSFCAKVPVQEFLSRCVDVQKFLKCCETCPNYGVRWSCPPYDFSPLDLWQEYSVLSLYARFLVPDGCTAQELLEGLKKEKTLLLHELLEKETGGAMALSCGCCDLCASCARLQQKPCLHPESCRYSIESLGGDVNKTSQLYFGKPLLWMKDNVLPEYMTLIGGLLEK